MDSLSTEKTIRSKLKPAIKVEWLTKLRSGTIQQARKALLDDGGRMCCLGVLARLRGVDDDALLRYRDYVGGRKELGPMSDCLDDNTRHDLARMNDDGKSFAEIADWIEANL